MEPKDPILTRDRLNIDFYVEMMSIYRIFQKTTATVLVSDVGWLPALDQKTFKQILICTNGVKLWSNCHF